MEAKYESLKTELKVTVNRLKEDEQSINKLLNEIITADEIQKKGQRTKI